MSSGTTEATVWASVATGLGAGSCEVASGITAATEENTGATTGAVVGAAAVGACVAGGAGALVDAGGCGLSETKDEDEATGTANVREDVPVWRPRVRPASSTTAMTLTVVTAGACVEILLVVVPSGDPPARPGPPPPLGATGPGRVSGNGGS